ncbi:hypothetical protein MCOR02_004425 [Pyricularia oryzae]|nr:hypothetical protein MCOR01_006182 [Pyricularia oryzae]KAH9435494.1 hypothetical protein MCOR02_004425 [Pyricularia oryzae]KAI6270842.1 hypothetical protein MCOR26_008057 [Pyricularia oryzae]KAI6374716.1 hypothetical protein MCOR31_002621 [Pyricularia oryzae]KAI6378442.1 hypothetical protein MCOR32_004696 [Pyricularia oryzae]
MSVYPNTNNYPLGHTLIIWPGLQTVDRLPPSIPDLLCMALTYLKPLIPHLLPSGPKVGPGRALVSASQTHRTNTFLFINDTFATNLISSAAQRKQPGNDNTTPLMGGDVGYWN